MVVCDVGVTEKLRTLAKQPLASCSDNSGDVTKLNQAIRHR